MTTPEPATPAIQDLYPEHLGLCYGCGPRNPHGNQLKSYVEGDDVVARFTPRPHHVSFPGFVYGGLIASLVDCHSMATASATAVLAAGGRLGEDVAPPYVTASLRVHFRKPTPLGPPLVLRGRVREMSGRKAIVDVTVSVNDVVTATAEAVAVVMPPNMQPGAATAP